MLMCFYMKDHIGTAKMSATDRFKVVVLLLYSYFVMLCGFYNEAFRVVLP